MLREAMTSKLEKDNWATDLEVGAFLYKSLALLHASANSDTLTPDPLPTPCYLMT